jgi:hypothetical protein
VSGPGAGGVARELDTVIRAYAGTYLGLTHDTNVDFYFSPVAMWGLGSSSVESLMIAEAYTDTSISLNNWDEARAWHTRAKAPGVLYKTIKVNEVLARMANAFSTALLGDIDREMGECGFRSFLLRAPWVLRKWSQGYHAGRRPMSIRLLRLLTYQGYCIDTPPLFPQSEGPASEHFLCRILPRIALERMTDFMLTHT